MGAVHGVHGTGPFAGQERRGVRDNPRYGLRVAAQDTRRSGRGCRWQGRAVGDGGGRRDVPSRVVQRRREAVGKVLGGRVVKGIFHIQHVNAYHRFLGRFLDAFHGVSTKYLNNYLTWNNTVVHTRAGFRQKVADMLDAIADTLFSETCLKVPKRPPIPILVKNQLNTKL